MHHTLMNLVITTLFKKYVDPQLKMSIFGSVLNSCVYNVNSTYPYIPGKALFAMVNQNVFFFQFLGYGMIENVLCKYLGQSLFVTIMIA